MTTAPLEDPIRSTIDRVASPAETMKAIVQDDYGTDAASVLRLEEIPRPAPGPGEVLVQVRAAGVDRGVWHLMAGRPYLVRLAGFGLRAPKARVRGSEVAGVVAAVGPDVTRFVVGDEVFGVAKGSFADFACARADKLTAKPADLGFVPAAAVAVSALTALQAVRDRGKVTAGQRVLVVGASGGVGSFAVQIATSSGAEVTGVCRGAKADLVRSLGAAHVVDYEHEDFAAVGNRYDVVIDTGGNSSLRRLRRCLTPRGTLVIVGGEGGGRWFGGIDRQLRATMLSLVVRQKLGTFIASENATDLDVLCRMVESGAIRPAVERTYPLAETPAAVEHVVAGRARGKVVVVVAG